MVFLRPTKNTQPFQSPTSTGSWLHICFLLRAKHCFSNYCTGFELEDIGLVFFSGIFNKHALVVYQYTFNSTKICLFSTPICQQTRQSKKKSLLFLLSIYITSVFQIPIFCCYSWIMLIHSKCVFNNISMTYWLQNWSKSNGKETWHCFILFGETKSIKLIDEEHYQRWFVKGEGHFESIFFLLI